MGVGKKTVETKIIDSKVVKKVKDQKDNDHYVILEEKTWFSFTNLRPGPFFFPKEDGSTDWFKGHETKDDISPKERATILKTKDFANGWVVENKEAEEITEETLFNKNSLSDSRIGKIIQKYKEDQPTLENIINDMTSEFAVKRFKDALIEADFASSLVLYCDHKLKKIEEEYLESKKAPIDKEQ